MPLGPISYSGYGFPSFGLGWQSPAVFSPPSFAYSYSYPSYNPLMGGRYFYGSYFSPSYGGVSFGPAYDNYEYNLMTAGYLLSGWGNIIEADPFYRAWYPTMFWPGFVPIPQPFFGAPANAGTTQTPVQGAQGSQGAQAGQAGQAAQGQHQNRTGSESERPSLTPEQVAEFNRTVERLEERDRRIEEESRRRSSGHGQAAEEAGGRTRGRQGV